MLCIWRLRVSLLIMVLAWSSITSKLWPQEIEARGLPVPRSSAALAAVLALRLNEVLVLPATGQQEWVEIVNVSDAAL